MEEFHYRYRVVQTDRTITCLEEDQYTVTPKSHSNYETCPLQNRALLPQDLFKLYSSGRFSVSGVELG